MEQVPEQRGSNLYYTLPIIAAAVPIAYLLARRAIGGCRCTGRHQLLHKSHLGMQDAIEVALDLVSGTPIEIDLQEHHGRPVWEVEIVPEKSGPVRQVLIDAVEGSVIEVRAETDV